MRSFEQYNPAATAVCLLCSALAAMFCANPVMLALSLCGAIALRAVRQDRESAGSVAFCAALLVVTPLFNLLFSHAGSTVLLVVNNRPLTLEALLYGLNTAVMLLAVLLWMRTFSAIMTTDRLMYLLGGASPKLALLLSMALRFIPLFGKQAGRINAAQRAMGMYRDDSIVDSARGGARVFSVLTTWALENGITTADSMRARGYGTGRRTAYTLYRFRLSDGILTAAALIPAAVCAVGVFSGAVSFEFYPRMSNIPGTPMAVATYISCGVLAFIPTFIETEAKLRWRSLRSGI